MFDKKIQIVNMLTTENEKYGFIYQSYKKIIENKANQSVNRVFSELYYIYRLMKLKRRSGGSELGYV